VIAFPLRGLVHPPDDLGEELAVEIRQEDAQRARSAGDQAAGGDVRRIAESGSYLSNSGTRLVADRPLELNTRDTVATDTFRLAGDVLIVAIQLRASFRENSCDETSIAEVV
jgi:hypothetical protein